VEAGVYQGHVLLVDERPTPNLPECTNCGTSSLAEVVSFERRSLPLLRMAFLRASAFAAADMMPVRSRGRLGT
jgi:hypothetical protein